MINPISSQTIRIFIVEPQPLMAHALSAVLNEDETIEIAGIWHEADAVRLAASRPDVIVVDCDADMPTLVATIAKCRRTVSEARICILTASLSADSMMAALSAGANGYVLKDITPAALLDSIKTVNAHGFYAEPRLSSMLIKRNVDRAPHELSPRELDVARLIAQGLSNKEIGGKLLLSDKTIKNHVANIFTKLNVNARTQVAIYAMRNGIL